MMKGKMLIVCVLVACGSEDREAPPVPPAEVASVWAAMIGEYAESVDTVSILEAEGELVLQFWGGERWILTESDDRVFETESGAVVRMDKDGDGRPQLLQIEARSFDRLTLGAEDGGTFRITPVRAPTELRAEALAASPPLEEGEFLDSDLVELVTLDSTIELDIRYASTNNFMGEVFYSEPKAFLQRPAADALIRANQWLHERGYGLLIHDGYRPWYVTKMFWEATPEDLRIFVANPANGSRHNRGCAIDLTLFDLATGEPIKMTGGYDEMSPRSFPDYLGGTSRQRWHRDLLREAMEAQGFTVYTAEWWHFDYQDWRSYRIGNERFEDLGVG